MGLFAWRPTFPEALRGKETMTNRFPSPHFPHFPRPSNREECSLRFETPDNTSNEQRGVLGSALLEEEYVLRCLSARAVTEAAQDQTRHAPLPADLCHRCAFHLGRVGFELFAQRVLLRGRGHKRISRYDHPRDDPRGPLA